MVLCAYMHTKAYSLRAVSCFAVCEKLFGHAARTQT